MPTRPPRWRDKFHPRRGPCHERCPDLPEDRERFIRERVRLDGPHFLLQQGIRYLIEGNADGFLLSCSEGNTQWLHLVIRNADLLHSLGLYESALVAAFTGTRTNNAAWPIDLLEGLFGCMDPDRLALLKPVPPGERFRVYRGVSGSGGWRRVRGLSWTRSVERAAWFARRLPLPDPAVYAATVSRDEVWWHNDDRGEDEFVVRPRTCRRLALTPDEILHTGAPKQAPAMRAVEESPHLRPTA